MLQIIQQHGNTINVVMVKGKQFNDITFEWCVAGCWLTSNEQFKLITSYHEINNYNKKKDTSFSYGNVFIRYNSHTVSQHVLNCKFHFGTHGVGNNSMILHLSDAWLVVD
jgi:hypothetical protein